VRRAACSALLALLALAASAPSFADEALWSQLRSGGFVIFVRHALTDPGVGDPAGFKLGDCKTERNLNAAGRAEAKRLGEAFRRERVPVSQVLSSEWCRCRDTAQIAFGTYEAWPALNNLFGRPENVEAQRRAMIERASRFRGPGNLVLVSHGSTIVPVTGVSPATAEMVVMKPAGAGNLELVGRIPVAPG
jgi:broad specificity phosphatase PhoE